MSATFRIITLAAAMAVVVGAPVFGQGDAKTTPTKMLTAPASSKNWVRSEMYFGERIPDGGKVTKGEFAKFLDDVVTKAFPEGMTVYEAYGQMQEKDGKIVKQRTVVIEIIHEQSKAKSDAIKSVINAYRKQFGNAQAMLLTSPAMPEFFTQ